ncbi:MAG: response regulator transcription factor [Planctomycetes bacterium]|nr:response regulator transcription factor [Planctomycetota bacterium]
MPTILIVEDDRSILAGLADLLRLEGFDVLTARDGATGLKLALHEHVDAVILDLLLPKLDGYDVCRRIRKDGLAVPILMLTAKAQEADKVVGLEVGADDYVTKPFGVAELVARIRALLRRAPAPDHAEPYEFGNVRIDFERRRVERSGKEVILTAREFELLRHFVENRGRVLTRDALLRAVWGYEDPPVTRTVDTHVASLRKKLERAPSKPRHFVGVHSVGYRFEA